MENRTETFAKMNIPQEKIKEMANQIYEEWKKTADPDTQFYVNLALMKFDTAIMEMEKNGIPEDLEIFKIIAAKRYGINEEHNISFAICMFATGFYMGLQLGADSREADLKEIAERNADIL